MGGMKPWGTAAWVGDGTSNKDVIHIDKEEAEQARVQHKWFGLEDVGRMQVHSQRLGIEKGVLDGQIALKQMQKDYPYEFATPEARSPWFYAFVTGICLLQLILLLVLVAHVTRPTLPQESAQDPVSVPSDRQGRVATAARKGGR
jgi:hypothetical protein